MDAYRLMKRFVEHAKLTMIEEGERRVVEDIMNMASQWALVSIAESMHKIAHGTKSESTTSPQEHGGSTQKDGG